MAIYTEVFLRFLTHRVIHSGECRLGKKIIHTRPTIERPPFEQGFRAFRTQCWAKHGRQQCRLLSG
ncbi:Uncharacterised protein [Vibrio cholerae]|nr:Uncharacterised protein [Vibrio cholerae]